MAIVGVNMLNKRLFLVFTVVFVIGWIAHSIYAYLSNDNINYDIDLGISEVNAYNEENSADYIEETKEDKSFFALFEKDSTELPSPFDRIKESQIHVLNNRVIIDIEDPEWAAFTDTNSMDPVFDYGTNAIEIVPKSHDEIHVGDIVSYRSDYADGVIIHRVIKIDEDQDGWYAILKGDNNDKQDPGKVRFDQIERILVAVIY